MDDTWIIFAALLGFMAFPERLELTTLVGCVPILGDGAVFARAGRTYVTVS